MMLIEKCGSVKSARVIQDFYENVIQDPLLRDLFHGVSIGDLAEHQADVLMMVMGGAHSHTHRQIAHAHRGLDITSRQFGAMLRHLESQLLRHGFDPADTEQIIAAYRDYQPVVTRSAG
jgi:hemoglobin